MADDGFVPYAPSAAPATAPSDDGFIPYAAQPVATPAPAQSPAPLGRLGRTVETLHGLSEMGKGFVKEAGSQGSGFMDFATLGAKPYLEHRLGAPPPSFEPSNPLQSHGGTALNVMEAVAPMAEGAAALRGLPVLKKAAAIGKGAVSLGAGMGVGYGVDRGLSYLGAPDWVAHDAGIGVATIVGARLGMPEGMIERMRSGGLRGLISDIINGPAKAPTENESFQLFRERYGSAPQTGAEKLRARVEASEFKRSVKAQLNKDQKPTASVPPLRDSMRFKEPPPGKLTPVPPIQDSLRFKEPPPAPLSPIPPIQGSSRFSPPVAEPAPVPPLQPMQRFTEPPEAAPPVAPVPPIKDAIRFKESSPGPLSPVPPIKPSMRFADIPEEEGAAAAQAPVANAGLTQPPGPAAAAPTTEMISVPASYAGHPNPTAAYAMDQKIAAHLRGQPGFKPGMKPTPAQYADARNAVSTSLKKGKMTAADVKSIGIDRLSDLLK